MKSVYLLIVIGLGAGGYYAYREGDLASFHPLLDPDSGEVVDSSEDDSTDGREGADSSDDRREADRLAKEARDEARKLAEAQKAQERADEKAAEAERKSMAEEEKRLAADAKARAKEVEKRREAERRHFIQAEVKALEAEYDSIKKKISQNHENLSDQEMAWVRSRIKTRDADKAKVRAASKRYEEELRAKAKAVYDKLKEKRREI